MTNSTPFQDEGFLASTADLVGLLVQFNAQPNRRSLRNRRDVKLAQDAYSHLFPGSEWRDHRPVPAASPSPAAPAADGRMAVANKEPMAGHATIAAEASNGISRIRRQQRCQCGSCQRCLDNAKWDRIFNEKFADPSYYGGLVVRHSSTLAEARR